MSAKEKVELRVTCFDLNGKEINQTEIMLPDKIAERILNLIR